MSGPYIGREPFTEASRSRIHQVTVDTQTIINTPYSPGYLDVYKNGVLLRADEYDATDGVSIILNVALTGSDNVETVAWGTFQVSDLNPLASATAWVKFTGVGSAVIEANFNVASVVRNVLGNYTVTFATPMDNANYAAVGTCDQIGCRVLSLTTASCIVESIDGSLSATDSADVSLAFFGGKD